jgi:CRP-like cAMP-binding protein
VRVLVRENEVATFGVGGVVGEYGLFTSAERTATLEARGKTRVLALDYERFKRFLHAFPKSLFALTTLTVQRLHRAQSPDD